MCWRERAAVLPPSYFAEDPNRLASDARLFWRADLDPSVVPASASVTDHNDPDAFDLFAQPVPAAVALTDDTEELLLGFSPMAIRLSIVAGSLLCGPRLLRLHIHAGQKMEIALATATRFAALRRGGRLPAPPRRSEDKTRRRLMLLATLNALAEGAGQRGVATALFGEERVAADWTGQSDFLRSRVRRLIAQAHALSRIEPAVFLSR